MPPKATPKSKAKKKSADTSDHASLSSPPSGNRLLASADIVETTSKKRVAKTYKSRAVVDSDSDDAPIVISANAGKGKKASVPAVTVTKRKMKPGDDSVGSDVVVISDSDVPPSDMDADDNDNVPAGYSTLDEDVISEGDDAVVGTGDADLNDDDEDDPEEDSKLVDGDTMYNAKNKEPARIRLKRPAPVTPPYATRSSQSVQETPNRSPTKKSRSGPAPTPQTPSPDKKRRHVAFSKPDIGTNKSNSRSFESASKIKEEDLFAGRSRLTFDNAAADIPSEPSIEKSVAPKKPAKRVVSVDSLDENDFPGPSDDDIVSTSQNKATASNTGERYHDDNRLLRIRTLPSVCEVSNPEAQDKWLKEKGHYEGLPNLKAVVLVPAKQTNDTKTGLTLFSKWRNFIPGMPMKQLLKSILFESDGRYINPSRVDPLSVSGRPTVSWSDSRFELCTGGNVTAVCVSPMMLTESHLHSMPAEIDFAGYFVCGRLHSQELNRMLSLFGMLLQKSEIQAHVWRFALTFGTKMKSQTKDSSTYENPALKDMFTSAGSPIKQSRQTKPSNPSINAIEPLAYEEKIPVYNAVGKPFECNADTFANLSDHFEPFEGEIPQHSCVIVGYIVQLHKQSQTLYRLYTYAKWIIVLAVPP
ncbi:hypothetical protein CPC08DRAFT_770667 [Agrocybe pediades]|nr:hypothetical protein CPC08DRAFT_770667 [Agrocybe pediades]